MIDDQDLENVFGLHDVNKEVAKHLFRSLQLSPLTQKWKILENVLEVFLLATEVGEGPEMAGLEDMMSKSDTIGVTIVGARVKTREETESAPAQLKIFANSQVEKKAAHY